MLQRLRKVRTDEDRGFTLIELLVVVVIIGVLVAIAIPVYLNYRKGAENTSASSDIRGAISAFEQYYTDNGNLYPGVVATAVVGTAGNNLTLTKKTAATDGIVTVSSGNVVGYIDTTSSYIICAQNSDGGTMYYYNSASGKPIGKAGAGSTSVATCLSGAGA
jgi:type IV pilus assembly protein PilA